jgi:hypothetical protein
LDAEGDADGQGNERHDAKPNRPNSAMPNGPLWLLNAEQPEPESSSAPIGGQSEQEPIFCETRFTDVLLVFLTYCLVIVGWSGIRMTVAAQQNMERAVLSLLFKEVDLARPVVSGTAGDQKILVIQPELRWAFFNSGRTAAFIESAMIGFIASGDAPPVPPYHDIEEFHFLDKTVAQNDSGEIASIKLDKRLPNAEIDLLKNGALFIWFYGAVNYLDVFEQPHETVFCFRSERDASLRMWGGKRYNHTT